MEQVEEVAPLSITPHEDIGAAFNAINAINSHIQNLQTCSWVEEDYNKLCNFVSRMDQVKNIRVDDYCAQLSDLLK